MHKKYKQNPEVMQHIREWNQAYYQRPKVKANRRKYASEYEHRPDVYEKRLAYRKEYEARQDIKNRRAEYSKTPKSRYVHYRLDAHRKNRDFQLTMEQFMQFWDATCHYCGDQIMGVGIDRVDSTKGYTLDNVVPCCAHCNRIKLDYSKEEFIGRCIKIAERFSVINI